MKNSKFLMYFSGFIVVINVILYLTLKEDSFALAVVSDFLPVIVSFLAVFFLYKVLKKFKIYDFTKIAWMLLFSGILLYFIAETTYFVLEIILGTDMGTTFPSAADFFWYIGYVPIFIGLMIIFFAYKNSGYPMGKMLIYILIGIAYIVITAVLVYILLLPMVGDEETDFISKLFYLFYPVADIFIVLPALAIMYLSSLFGKGLISRPWKLLALAFILFSVADILYSYLDWNDSYGRGNFIDLAWNLGYLSIAFSAAYQSELLESLNVKS